MKIEDMTIKQAKEFSGCFYIISAQGVLERKMEDVLYYSRGLFTHLETHEHCFTTKKEAKHCLKYYRLRYLETELLEQEKSEVRKVKQIADIKADIIIEKNKLKIKEKM